MLFKTAQRAHVKKGQSRRKRAKESGWGKERERGRSSQTHRDVTRTRIERVLRLKSI